MDNQAAQSTSPFNRMPLNRQMAGGLGLSGPVEATPRDTLARRLVEITETLEVCEKVSMSIMDILGLPPIPEAPEKDAVGWPGMIGHVAMLCQSAARTRSRLETIKNTLTD